DGLFHELGSPPDAGVPQRGKLQHFGGGLGEVLGVGVVGFGSPPVGGGLDFFHFNAGEELGEVGFPSLQGAGDVAVAGGALTHQGGACPVPAGAGGDGVGVGHGPPVGAPVKGYG